MYSKVRLQTAVHKVADCLSQDCCELCTDVAYTACCFCSMQSAMTDTPCQMSLFSLRLRACMMQEAACVTVSLSMQYNSKNYLSFCRCCMLVYVLSRCILCRSSWVCSQHVRHCTQICWQTFWPCKYLRLLCWHSGCLSCWLCRGEDWLV